MQYMVKAMHEAKINLSWINPDQEYVEAVSKFIRQVLTPGAPGKNSFLRNMGEFLPAVQFFGAINSLSQTLLKITSPGVPDIYQGTEMWDFSLVDPDNRRPVDFNLRREALNSVKGRAAEGLSSSSLAAELLANFQDGHIKLFTTLRAMEFRSRNQELFRTGGYIPLEVTGEKRDHVVAFAREYQSPLDGEHRAAIVAVPRFAYTLMKGRIAAPVGDVWGETAIQITPNTPHLLENIFTGEAIEVTNRRTILCRQLFSAFPLALLASR
jgi:(1->4)-alpha-D-glucan 1-alpha-D-glucosylmutase